MCPHPARPAPQVPLLTALRPQQRLALCTAFGSRVVPAGQAVIRKGEEGDTFYIIEEGGCTVVGEEGQVGVAGACGEAAAVLWRWVATRMCLPDRAKGPDCSPRWLPNKHLSG